MSGNNVHKVPVFQTQTSVIDNEFSSIRERFDNEIRRMESEMNAFRNKMLEKENEFFKNTSSISSNFNSSFNNQVQRQEARNTHSSSNVMQHTSGTGSNWLNDLDSPLVHDTSDGKMLKLRFDVTQYAPEEILVKTVDNKLQVSAKHEENSENRNVFREYKREFLLPPNVNPELIRSSLSKDGVLTVEAPLTAIEGGQHIPISHH